MIDNALFEEEEEGHFVCIFVPLNCLLMSLGHAQFRIGFFDNQHVILTALVKLALQQEPRFDENEFDIFKNDVLSVFDV